MSATFPRLLTGMVGIAGVASLLAACGPDTPYLASELRPLTLGLSAAWGLWRVLQVLPALTSWWAWRHGLPWPLDPAHLPPHTGLLLGRGFRWDASHTQVLERALFDVGALPLDTGPLGGHPVLHAVGDQAEDVLALPSAEANRHVMLTGSPGSGKTVAFELLATDAIRQPGVTVVIDPKPSASLMQRCYTEAQRAGKPWGLLIPAWPQHSMTMDVLGTATTPAEVTTRIQALMPSASGGRAGDPFFEQYPLALIEHVAAAQQELGRRWTLEGLYRDTVYHTAMGQLLLDYLQHLGVTLSNPTPRHPLQAHMAAYRSAGLDNLVADALIEDFEHDPDHFRKVTASLLPTFRGVIGPPLGHLFSSPTPDLTWRRIVDESMVVYVALGAMLHGELANRIGRMVIQDLIGFLGRRYTYERLETAPQITVLVDELARVLYPQFPMALAMSREAKCRWILAQQSYADAEAVLGRPAARVMMDNAKTKLYFALGESLTAQELAEGFGTCTVQLPKTRVMLATGGGRGLSRGAGRELAETKTPLFRHEWLQALPIGHFVAQIDGTLWKGQAPRLTAPEGDVLGELDVLSAAPEVLALETTLEDEEEEVWNAVEDMARSS